jgi:hypothetical protein
MSARWHKALALAAASALASGCGPNTAGEFAGNYRGTFTTAAVRSTSRGPGQADVTSGRTSDMEIRILAPRPFGGMIDCTLAADVSGSRATLLPDQQCPFDAGRTLMVMGGSAAVDVNFHLSVVTQSTIVASDGTRTPLTIQFEGND